MTEDETLSRLDASIAVPCKITERPPGWKPGQVSKPAAPCSTPSTTIMRCRKCKGVATVCTRHADELRADHHIYTHACGAEGTWSVLMEFELIASAP
jgi:hypothetical protein